MTSSLMGSILLGLAHRVMVLPFPIINIHSCLYCKSCSVARGMHVVNASIKSSVTLQVIFDNSSTDKHGETGTNI